MTTYDSWETQAIVETAAKFAQDQIAPLVDKEDEERSFPWALVRAGASAGYLNGALSEQLGGAELDELSQLLIVENLARGSAAVAGIFAFHTSALAAVSCADSQPVRGWLAKLVAELEGDRPPVAALAVPETVVDLDRPVTPQLRPANGGAMLTGDFVCLFDPVHADKVVLLTGSEPGAKLALLDAPALLPYCREAYGGSGLEYCPVARLRVDGLSVASAALLPPAGDVAPLSRLRLSLAAIQLGTASQAAAQAAEYARERRQTGRLIIEHQEVETGLANMEMQLEAARSMLYRATTMVDGQHATRSLQTYRFCGDVAEQVCLDAVQTLGGYGYMRDYGIEQRLRDVKSLQCILGSHVADWFG